MRFVKNGPDIPDRLIQAHEDGEVVFFCGAGISYPAGLPGFQGLVDQLYERLGEARRPEERTAYDENRFDGVIDLLERRVARRDLVRGHLADILQPDFSRKGATDTHRALLALARSKDGNLRLVTTNFDRIFAYVNSAIRHYVAPLLPVPKRSRWDGLVYLHGLLPEKKDPQQLNQLVVSSGDFGLAYLTERWASRFVTELFRGYTVCFVGYSINDPVMRYMVDALSADRMMGETTPDVFAVGGFKARKRDRTEQEWRAKGVVPILYPEQKGPKGHSLLYKTLRSWAEVYRDGLSGKCAIITREAGSLPSSLKDDGHIDRVLWALCEPSGTPAKTFADLDPVPPIEWLLVFDEVRYGPPDLPRFRICPFPGTKDCAGFSLAHRPTPYEMAPWMSLVDSGAVVGGWDEVMGHLARWLVRHLDKPEVMAWVLRHGGRPHPRFLNLIEDQLGKGVLAGPLTAVWRLFSSGRIAATRSSSFRLYDWISRFKAYGWIPSLRMELLDLLQPMVRLREAFRWPVDEESRMVQDGEPRIKDFIDWEIVLRTGDHVRSPLQGIFSLPEWKNTLVELLPDLTGLLRDSIDLMRELGEADEKHDDSYSFQPSIGDHPQNTGYHEWTVLVELCRDAWIVASEQNPEQARLELTRWRQIKYPVFLRLRLFAAANSSLISVEEGLSLLLSDEAWWLWSPETQREALRLLVFLAPKLPADKAGELFEAILSGPPRQMYRDDVEPDRLQRSVEHEIWLRIEKCREAGVLLPESAERERQRISALHPKWKVQPDESDEFPVWTGTGDEWRRRTILPRPVEELVKALIERPESDFWYEDDWRERCRDDSRGAIDALVSLTKLNKWHKSVWREALQVFADETLFAYAWEHLAPVLAKAPPPFVEGVRHALGIWLQSASKQVKPDEAVFYLLVDRILDGAVGESVQEDDDPVFRAINHPVGQVTKALIRLWYRMKPVDCGGYPGTISCRLNRLVDPRVPAYRHGRVILGAHLVALFRVDADWAKANLLPFFAWGKDKAESRAVWEGFLWAPRLYKPLIVSMKAFFLETAAHYEDLGKHDGQYASLLTLAALEFKDVFSTKDLRSVFSKLPAKGLEATAHIIVRALSDAGDKRAEYWVHRVKPFIASIWPKSAAYRSSGVSMSLAEACVSAGDAFPDAVDTVMALLVQSEDYQSVANALAQSDLCLRYPEDTLKLLDAVVDENQRWPPEDLKKCLKDVGQSAPELRDGVAFRRLLEYLQRHGFPTL